MKYTIEMCDSLAKRKGLIFEKLDRPYKMEGVTYRYEITDNSRGMSEDCTTIAEAYSVIYYW